jgi:hypothetical protein
MTWLMTWFERRHTAKAERSVRIARNARMVRLGLEGRPEDDEVSE